MRADCIFFRELGFGEDQIQLSSEEVQHLKSLRLFGIDKKIEIRNGRGHGFLYFVSAKSRDARKVENSEIQKPALKTISLAGGIPKGNRLDWLLQKSTELGVTNIYFCNWERSVRQDFNTDRSHRIIQEASAQSNRYYLLNVQFFSGWEELREKIQAPFVFLDPSAKDFLGDMDSNRKDICIPLIGPEGGFSERELSIFREAGIPGYHLGSGILRMETAYLYTAVFKSL
jgi:16S rRNA (uracil1498-N3)-methyltransferase